ncbi:heterodisulfide reductase-related iron-sulfur binding cluster [Thermodesulfobacteriota bacterium]
MDPESIIRDVVDLCGDCDVCRYLMESTCLFFPTMYQLIDREVEAGEKITPRELRDLVDLCNFCAVCPCPNIRADIIKAKTRFVERDGLKFGIRTLENVERIGRLCGAVPKLSNFLLQNRFTVDLTKSILNIHKERKIPEFPIENFDTRARRDRLNAGFGKSQKRKVAYFAGCTGRFFFPDVPGAAVEVLKHNNIDVYYPEQQCCGMPCLLEGDRQLSLAFAEFNVERLFRAVEDGYDIVCSCPTCGYVLKDVLKAGAYYSSEYQASIGANSDHMKVHIEPPGPEERQFISLHKSTFESILKDDSYFSHIDPLKRIRVAERTFDLGEYLVDLHRADALKTTFGTISGRTVYYPPCHLREQDIGRPYLDLLGLVPGITIDRIDGAFYCCGMAGIMGYKDEFHRPSIKMGKALMEKIEELKPERLVTDCLSCRLQFNQLTSYEVRHPIEILKEAYDNQ